MTNVTESLAEALRLADSVTACSSEHNVRAFQVAAGQLVYLHGPALLAALRLREALSDEVALLRAWAKESRDGGWSTHQVDPMLRRADDLARVLEESVTGGDAGSA